MIWILFEKACGINFAGLFLQAIFCLLKKSLNEGIGVEFGDVLWFFTEADELYGYVKLVLDGNDNAAASCSVEFCEENACEVDGLCEHFRLSNGVLSGGGVEYEQDFVGCVGDFSGDDVSNFCQLPHEVFLGVESSSSVENEKISISGDGGLAGIEGDGGRVSTGLVFYDLNSDSVSPDCELFDGGGAEGITSGDDYVFFVLA